MSRIIALANQKGGVGKTTTAINLGAALGALEQQVLVVDCDPQGNASRGLGCKATSPHLYHVLSGESGAAAAVRRTGFPGLSLLPADRELVGMEVELVGQDGWEHRLRVALAPLRRDYDIVLLDCPPSLGHLTVNALAAADQVLVPLQCEYYALEGISELIATIRRIQGRIHPALELGGILLTMYDDRTNLSRDVVAEAREHFQGIVYETVIPRNVRLAEAPSHGVPILAYDIKSRGGGGLSRRGARASGAERLMATKRRGLGRGLGALLGDEEAAAGAAGGAAPGPPASPTRLPIDELAPNRFQPRTHFDERKLADLADSIRAQGVVQPIVVTPRVGRAGSSRSSPANDAGALRGWPGWNMFRSSSGRSTMIVSCSRWLSSRTVQRSDLDPIEEAEAYRLLVERFSLAQEEIAKRVGKGRTTITNTLRLLRLPPSIQDACEMVA
jgi:chromosome partitioning protein